MNSPDLVIHSLDRLVSDGMTILLIQCTNRQYICVREPVGTDLGQKLSKVECIVCTLFSYKIYKPLTN